LSRITEITSRECLSYIKNGGDLAVVPVGAIERTGPHLPLGAAGFVAEAIAELISTENNGVCLPLIPYGTVYDTFSCIGSIDVDPDTMHKYCWDLCDELTANGFKRIIFVSFQDDFYYLGHQYFQEKNVAVACLSPDRYHSFPGSVASSLDAHGRELWRLIGCLDAMGEIELIEDVLRKTEEYFHMFAPVVDERKLVLNKLGKTGHAMLENEWRFYPVNLGKSLEDASAPFEKPGRELINQARAELIDWIASLAEPIADLSEYQRYLDGHAFARPI